MAEDLSDIFESIEWTLLTTGWGRAEGMGHLTPPRPAPVRR